MTEEHADILLHMTGLDRSDEPTRNHFACEPGGRYWAALQGLAALGLVRQCGGQQELFGGDVFFRATEAGLAEARELREGRGT